MLLIVGNVNEKARALIQKEKERKKNE